MRVLVTGAAGMLGSDLVSYLSASGHEPVPADIQQFDITDMTAVADFTARSRPDAIIHCAAMTDVDACEKDPMSAFRINAVGTWNMAVAAAEKGIPIIGISTDYVFDGLKEEPYTEYDRPAPINSYGLSKLAAEEAICRCCARYKIVRTSWLYGRNGRNFVYAILDKAAAGVSGLQVVDDQHGAPTYAADLAAKLTELLDLPHTGIFHVTGGEVCSWYELAQAVIEQAGYNVEVRPISSKELDRPARRPANSALDNLAIRGLGLKEMRSFRETLDEMIEAYRSRER